MQILKLKNEADVELTDLGAISRYESKQHQIETTPIETTPNPFA
ncbi:hypothetical protein VCHA29O37_580016 [Vibrio chagasii]|nr:hypothetical protein VCHA29O37_580016 [Vibrio chagasii]